MLGWCHSHDSIALSFRFFNSDSVNEVKAVNPTDSLLNSFTSSKAVVHPNVLTLRLCVKDFQHRNVLLEFVTFELTLKNGARDMTLISSVVCRLIHLDYLH